MTRINHGESNRWNRTRLLEIHFGDAGGEKGGGPKRKNDKRLNVKSSNFKFLNDFSYFESQKGDLSRRKSTNVATVSFFAYFQGRKSHFSSFPEIIRDGAAKKKSSCFHVPMKTYISGSFIHIFFFSCHFSASSSSSSCSDVRKTVAVGRSGGEISD